MADRSQKRRRGGGRAGNAERCGVSAISQMPWQIPINNDRPTEPLNEDGVQAVHTGAMQILEEIGIEILNDEALEIFRDAGAIIKDQNVRIDRDFIMEMLGKAPETWTLTPPQPRAYIAGGWQSDVVWQRQFSAKLLVGRFRRQKDRHA